MRRQAAMPFLAAAAAAVLLSGCAQPSRPRASAAVVQRCRMEVDRIYSAQNRVDLSTRDTRDTPFASNYVSGITSRGLGAEYGRDNMTQSCINEASTGGRAAPAGTPGAAAASSASTGPTFGTSATTGAARPGSAP